MTRARSAQSVAKVRNLSFRPTCQRGTSNARERSALLVSRASPPINWKVVTTANSRNDLICLVSCCQIGALRKELSREPAHEQF